MVCVGKEVSRDGVGVVVGGAEDVVFIHFVEMITKDGGDVCRGCLWEIYVDQECTGSGRVVGVNACEVEVIDELRCVVWRDRI